MDPEVLDVFLNHGIFTVGNYFYNGVGHLCVQYDRVISKGFSDIRRQAQETMAALRQGDGDFARRRQFCEAVIECCDAAVRYAKRYAKLAREEAMREPSPDRRQELARIADNCERVPEFGATTFHPLSSRNTLSGLACRKRSFSTATSVSSTTVVCSGR